MVQVNLANKTTTNLVGKKIDFLKKRSWNFFRIFFGIQDRVPLHESNQKVTVLLFSRWRPLKKAVKQASGRVKNGDGKRRR